jgi:hypothetical protein
MPMISPHAYRIVLLLAKEKRRLAAEACDDDRIDLMLTEALLLDLYPFEICIAVRGENLLLDRNIVSITCSRKIRHQACAGFTFQNETIDGALLRLTEQSPTKSLEDIETAIEDALTLSFLK